MLRDWRNTGSLIEFRGHPLFVREEGRGPTVALMHAFPTSSYDYSKIMALLRSRYRLIMFDYPGFGFSAKPVDYDYSLLTYADAFEAVVQHFGATPLFVVAHDIGASTILEVLRRERITIDRLVLLNTSIVPQSRRLPTLSFARAILQHPILGGLIGWLRLVRRPMLAHTLKPLFALDLTPTELQNFWSLLRSNDGPRIYPRLISYMAEREQYGAIWLDALARYSAPLGLIWGERDPIATPFVADAIQHMHPTASATRLATVGHYPHWEAPEITASAIDRVFSA